MRCTNNYNVDLVVLGSPYVWLEFLVPGACYHRVVSKNPLYGLQYITVILHSMDQNIVVLYTSNIPGTIICGYDYHVEINELIATITAIGY